MRINRRPCKATPRQTLAVALVGLLAPSGAIAGTVVFDGTAGRFGPASQAGRVFDIKADDGALRGANLFHSFKDFNLSKGDVARFTGPASVQNVLARVTGGPSSIDGRITCDIQGANFFLMNRSGVVFGPNADLQLSGSFAVTTADKIVLGSDGVFYSDPKFAESVLTSSAPTAFGFLSANPTAVAMNGSTLRVNSAQAINIAPKTLSVSGGSVSITGGVVQAPAGRVNIVAVGTNTSEITVDALNPSTIPGLAVGGDISISSGAEVGGSAIGNEIGAEVLVRGRNLSISDASIRTRNTFPQSATLAAGIDIAVTGNVSLTGNSAILTGSYTNGVDAGNINITAGGDLTLAGGHGYSTIRSEGGSAVAAPGNIHIDAGSVSLIGPAEISTSVAQVLSNNDEPTRPGGAIVINTHGGPLLLSGLEGTAAIRTAIISDPSATLSHRVGNDIDITAKSIRLEGVSEISSVSDYLTPGGDISLTSESLQLDGADPTRCRIYTRSGRNFGTISSDIPGKGGDIVIHGSPAISVADSSQIFTAGSVYVGVEDQPLHTAIGPRGAIIPQSSLPLPPASSIVPDAGVVETATTIGDLTTGLLTRAEAHPSNANLFFSFQQLSLGTRDTLILASDDGATVNNVIARVIGGTPSRIDGRIGIPDDANLFLVNSAGIVFGPTASLDIGGSLVATTANNFVLAMPLLTAPQTFTFTPGNSGGVSIQGSFLTPNAAGKSISIVASRIEVDNAVLFSDQGKINLVALSQGTATFTPPTTSDVFSIQPLTGELSLSEAPVLGDIVIQGMLKATSSPLNNLTARPIQFGAASAIDGAASLVMAGRDLVMNQASLQLPNQSDATNLGVSATFTRDVSLTTASLDTSAGGQDNANNAGPISIQATNIILDGAGFSNSSFGLLSRSLPFSPTDNKPGGNAGQITVNASGDLSVSNGARISTSSITTGNGGAINVTADRVSLTGQTGSGQTGITADTGENGGAAGSISLDVRGALELHGGVIQTTTSGAGAGGMIAVDAGSLLEQSAAGTGVATISASSSGAGAGGSINIGNNRPSDVLVDGGSVIRSNTSGVGAGGTIVIRGSTVNVAGTGAASQISASTSGAGRGGSVDVGASQAINVTHGASVESASTGTSAPAGDAGSILMRAPVVNITNGGSVSVSANSVADANGGDLTISASRINLESASLTSVASKDGGEILLNSSGEVDISNTLISGEAENGNGGNITIGPASVTVPSRLPAIRPVIAVTSADKPDVYISRSRLIAKANGEGNGGNILVLANRYLASADTVFDASSVFGNPGSITIESVDQNVTRGLIPLRLPPAVISPLSSECAMMLGLPISSFTLSGAGGEPVGASGWLPEFGTAAVFQPRTDEHARRE